MKRERDMANTVNLVNLSINKFDAESHLTTNKKLMVPLDTEGSRESAALKLLSIALVSGINQQFRLNQSTNRKFRALSFSLENPIFSLPSIAFLNHPLQPKEYKKLFRSFRLIEILPLSVCDQVNNERACFVDDKLIEALSQKLSNRLDLDVYLEEGEIAVTINEQDFIAGKIKNGRLLVSTILDLEQKLAS